MDPLTCPFCNPSPEDIILANDLCYARYDKYPASPGHLLLIPFRRVAGFFDDRRRTHRPPRPRPRGENPPRRTLPPRRLQHRRKHRESRRPDSDAPPPPHHPALHRRHRRPTRRDPGRDPGEESVSRGLHRVPGRISKQQEKAVFPAAGEVELPGFKRKRSSLYGWSRDPRVL